MLDILLKWIWQTVMLYITNVSKRLWLFCFLNYEYDVYLRCDFPFLFYAKNKKGKMDNHVSDKSEQFRTHFSLF